MLSRFLLCTCVLGVVGSFVAIGCKRDPARTDADVCERAYSVCPNVVPVSSQDVTNCARSLDGPCGTTMRQYLRCVAGKCDDAGGIDLGAVESSCGVVLDAYRTCTSTDGGTIAHPAPDEPDQDAEPFVDAGARDAS